MWPWMKRWRDWAMNDLWPRPRSSPQPRALHFSYEKAGLTVDDQPIPWNADAVIVEVSLKLTNPASRKKSDFQVRLPGQEPIAPDFLRPDELAGAQSDHYRLFFRFPVPSQSTSAEVLWKSTSLGQLTLPLLSRDDFLGQLSLQLPTLLVRLGNESVACQTFVSTQCKGLLAVASLGSTTNLAPVVDLGLCVEFRAENDLESQRVPIQLSSSQLKGRQALLAVVPPKFPKRLGIWQATWLQEDRLLASQRVRAISLRHFLKSLRITDCYFIVEKENGSVGLCRKLPDLSELKRLAPCFLISSAEPGMAGICSLEMRPTLAQRAGTKPIALEQELLITDGPTRFVPGSILAADAKDLGGFELRIKGKVLGALSLSPAPKAAFTSEGGFKDPGDYHWSATTEEELSDRLSRLLEERPNLK